MAQIVYQICDVHAAKDEQVRGEQVTNPLNDNEVIDLCEEHRKQLDALLEPVKALFSEYGHSLQPQPKAEPQPKTKRRRKDAQPLSCPAKGCGFVETNRRRLREHVRSVHKVTLAELEAADESIDTPFQCKECQAAFGGIQGLGMHRWRRHNIPVGDTAKEYAELTKAVLEARKRGERYTPAQEETPPPSNDEKLAAMLNSTPDPMPQGVFHQ